MTLWKPDEGVHVAKYVKIGPMELPAPPTSDYVGVILRGLLPSRATGKYNHYRSDRGTAQATDTHTLQNTLQMELYLRTDAPYKQKRLLQGLEGNDVPACWHEGNADGTPSVDEPLQGGLLSLSAFNFAAGTLGGPAEVNVTFEISGHIEELTAPLPAPTGLSLGAPAPTADTITATWDGSGDFLPCYTANFLVSSYAIRWKKNADTVWGAPVDVPNTGPGTITYPITGLDASTDYDVEVFANWFGCPGTAATATAQTAA